MPSPMSTAAVGGGPRISGKHTIVVAASASLSGSSLPGPTECHFQICCNRSEIHQDHCDDRSGLKGSERH
jgi:hypothetical protein